MGEKIFLSGGLGFIGHNLALELKNQGFEPIVFDNFSHNICNPWHQWVVDERCEKLRKHHIKIIPGDTRVMESMQRAILQHSPDRILHLAATPSIILSNQNPSSAIDHNFVATRNMLEILRLNPSLNIKQFLFFSSSTVYGDFKQESVSEETFPEPKGIYAASKLASELIIKAYHNLIGIPYTILRPSALYGQGCINNRVSQIFIEKALLNQPLDIEGNGEEKLDFTYIKDLVQGVVAALTQESAMNQIFNITYGQGRPINDLVQIIKEYVPNMHVSYVARDKMKPLRGTLQIERAKKLLNYHSKYSLDIGYREYIEWYLSSPFKKLMQ